MRIFAAGLATETNTFAPVLTGADDFMVLRGRDVSAGRVDYPALDLSAVWGRQAEGHELIFSLNAWAEPSGVTLRRVYESLRDEILADLAAALPIDVVLLMLHGAMVAEGYPDCEEDLIRRVRSLVGSQTVIAVELDLHCHLTASKISAADIVITYKEYPHVDINERAKELFDLAVAAREQAIHPVMELFDCRMIGLYPTTREPLRSLVDGLMSAEKRNGVLSISFGHSFPFADLPTVGAKMLVVTDGDRRLARRLARSFGLQVYGMRHQIGFDSVSLPMQSALERALALGRGPVVVADQSDNVGAGAPSDATFALRWLLDHGVRDAATAIFYDPEVVKIVKKAGPGATLAIRLGGKTGPSSGAPVDMTVTVLAARDDYMHARPQQSGDILWSPVGDVVAIRCQGIDIVIGSKRCQCYCPSIFSDLGIDPKAKRLLIPKSYQHFYGGFAPIATEVIYMAAPGAVPPDPKQIHYARLDTAALYPWNSDPLGSG